MINLKQLNMTRRDYGKERHFGRGIAVYKVPVKKNSPYGEITRMKFVIDENIPVFSADDCTLFTDISVQAN